MIDILTSVRNGEEYIALAIKSVLEQTCADFSFYIVDDASDDSTSVVIRSFKDCRIKFFQNMKPRGLTENLNFLLGQSKGEHIARFDADDICQKDRLEKEMQFMAKNKLDIIGSDAFIIDRVGKVKGEIRYKGKDIKKDMFVANVFLHSSVLMKRKIFGKLCSYREKYPRNEDYDLWLRALKEGFRLGVCREKLINFRVYPSSVSLVNLKEQQINSIKLRFSMIQNKTYPVFYALCLVPQLISYLLPKNINLLIHKSIYHS